MSPEQLYVAVWDCPGALPPNISVCEDGLTIHWCNVDARVDTDVPPPAEARAASVAASRDGISVSSHDALAILTSNEVRELSAEHSNVVTYALRVRGGKLTLKVGVTAKGFVPVGEALFPEHLEVFVPVDDGEDGRRPSRYDLRVDVCRGWFRESVNGSQLTTFRQGVPSVLDLPM